MSLDEDDGYDSAMDISEDEDIKVDSTENDSGCESGEEMEEDKDEDEHVERVPIQEILDELIMLANRLGVELIDLDLPDNRH